MDFKLILCILALLIIRFLPIITNKVNINKYRNKISLENISPEFQSLYDHLYSTHISSLEIMRKKVKWRIIFEYALMLLSIVIMITGIIISKQKQSQIQLDELSPLSLVALQNNTMEAFKIHTMFFIIVMLIFIIWFIFSHLHKKYKNDYIISYKNNVVSNFIALISDRLTYKPITPENVDIADYYKQAMFDDKYFNRFTSDDYIEGYLNNNTYIKSCEIHTQYINRTGKHRTTRDVFHGIFVSTNCSKNINTSIKITKNNLELFDNAKQLNMDSETFEKYFNIYSEDKILAMRLLSSDVMESLIEFHNKYNLDFEIVFRDNTIYLRFFTGAMFEPSIFSSSMSKDLLFSYYTIFNFIINFTKKINSTLQEFDI